MLASEGTSEVSSDPKKKINQELYVDLWLLILQMDSPTRNKDVPFYELIPFPTPPTHLPHLLLNPTMITFMEPKEKLTEHDKCLDPQLWHACAGSMVQMPPVNSKVLYFPQGHVEHASENVDFRNLPRAPPYVLCCVSAVRFLADPETDEVFAKIRLSPVSSHEANLEDNDCGPNGLSGPADNQEKPASFAKTLTQSDANNGGGFSVPRYCAETIFPRLDYSVDPPVQTILAKDVHGETWKFRHIYRGTPRRHLLTTGWSTFVNQKKLVAGDSIVFMRSENGGELCVGIRRAKRGIGPGGGPEVHAGWNYGGGFSSLFLREDEGKMGRNDLIGGRGRVRAEDVIEAVGRAASGREFDVVYYPRASTPEFCVRASLVKAALQVRWCSGMRFKMAFETEDSSRISWFMGTVSGVQVADPIRWPDSPWRLLQVAWDEPDLLQNVKRVSPWLVELVSNMPAIHLSPFSSPRKKLRLPGHPEYSPLDSQFPLPPFSGGPFSGNCLLNSNNTPPAGMQGARHAQYSLSSLSDNNNNNNNINNNPRYPKNIIPASFFPFGYPPFDRAPPAGPITPGPCSGGNVSCQLTMGCQAQSQETGKSSEGKHAQAPFLLFGQKIVMENRVMSYSSETVNSSSEGNGDKNGNTSDGIQSEEPGQCKVFMEYEDVGRTLDLSLIATYEELYQKLADLFGVEVSEIENHVLYREASGCVKRVGRIPFSDFVKAARRLTILTDSSSDNL
ncbi:auxin response factor [Striga asiatica]|uniref:Auxin response factor n=1 Tax=Striga asiatica TaxID=4170 RepID=A0A5A7QKP4_STRAF|nr:auxin response factor [Striga asiatica]